MIYQRTLKKTISATGIGLHSGEKVSIKLCPAPADTGIRFKRMDLETPGKPVGLVCASVANVSDTHLATSLCSRGVRISTVEHLLAAFSGLGVDNAIVEVDAAELPIMDGSASPFVYLLQSAGIEVLTAAKKFIRILKPTTIREGGISASLSPYEGFKLEYTLEYDHPVFQKYARTSCVEFSSSAFVKDIARARTFGFLADFELLRSMDLARGGSLDNAVVVDDYRILNEEGLRLDDEFVKHKILDAIGDLSLLGHNIIGMFNGCKSGHSTNYQLLKEVLRRSDAWEVVSFSDPLDAPASFSNPALDWQPAKLSGT